MSEQEGIGAAMARFFRAIKSLLTTGSMHAEDAADKARSAQVLIEHIPEAAEAHTQKVMMIADEGLTHWKGLLNDRDRQQKIVEIWNQRAQTAATKAKVFAEGTKERRELEQAAKSALDEAIRAEERLKRLDAMIAEIRPEAEAALEAVHQAGLNREQALDEADALSIQNASAEARRRLTAATSGVDTTDLQRTLSEAREKVFRAVARAESADAIAEQLPQDSSVVGTKIDQITREQEVDARFAALMGTDQAAPAGTATP